jgi:RES domain-containing protein
LELREAASASAAQPPLDAAERLRQVLTSQVPQQQWRRSSAGVLVPPWVQEPPATCLGILFNQPFQRPV